MISKIKQSIKDFLRSRYSPDLLSSFYFDQKDKKDRKDLATLLEGGADLLEGVQEGSREYWESRIGKVLDSKDNQYIPRHERAGSIVDGLLIMHNGIKVDPLSYYSFGTLKMLSDNKGVHEPQEEKVFQEVLKTIDPNRQATMLELGAYWSFYSMWFLSLFPEANCYMVEPIRKNLHYGKRNFQINNLKGVFIHAGIGNEKNYTSNVTTVDEICRTNKIAFLDILHADIQGYELEMLHGSKRMLSENRVGYIFISTHSNALHADCTALLCDYGFIEIASVDLDETCSWDGVLVMRSSDYSGIERVVVSKESKDSKTRGPLFKVEQS